MIVCFCFYCWRNEDGNKGKGGKECKVKEEKVLKEGKKQEWSDMSEEIKQVHDLVHIFVQEKTFERKREKREKKQKRQQRKKGEKESSKVAFSSIRWLLNKHLCFFASLRT